MASNLGFVLGPAIAALLGGTGLGDVPPVLAAIGISLLASAIILLGLSESTPCTLTSKPEKAGVSGVLGQEHKECYQIQRAPDVSLSDALRPHRIRVLLVIHFLVFLAFNFYYVSFPMHAATRLDWTLVEVGIFFSTMGLMMAVVQGPVLGWASKHFEDRTLVLVGSLILAIAFALYRSNSVGVIYAATAGVALGNGLMWPSLLALLSTAADHRTQGAVQGFASSIAAVASIVGLLLGGLLYEQLSGSIFVVSGGIAALAGRGDSRIDPRVHAVIRLGRGMAGCQVAHRYGPGRALPGRATRRHDAGGARTSGLEGGRARASHAVNVTRKGAEPCPTVSTKSSSWWAAATRPGRRQPRTR